MNETCICGVRMDDRETYPKVHKIQVENEGTNSLVNGQIGQEGMVHCVWSHNECHKTRNGWYLGMVMPISSIHGLLTLYSKNVVGLLTKQ